MGFIFLFTHKRFELETSCGQKDPSVGEHIYSEGGALSERVIQTATNLHGLEERFTLVQQGGDNQRFIGWKGIFPPKISPTVFRQISFPKRVSPSAAR